MTSLDPGPIPVTLINGFLGAGKTTVLKHLLQSDHGRRLGVIVNDFGAINIDAELIREVHGDTQTVRLTNGCICCTVRDDLLHTVVQLASQSDPPEHVVIETSGIADPEPIVRTFRLVELASLVRLDAVAVVLAPDQFASLPPQSRELALRQLGCADLVLLNKMDLACGADLATVKRALAGHAPGVRTIECVNGAVCVAVLLGADAAPAGGSRTRPPDEQRAYVRMRERAGGYQSFSWECDEPLDAERLRDAMPSMPASILRGKGFVQVAQAPNEQGIFHLVGARASLTRGAPWEERPRTRLVFIGEPDREARARVFALLGETRAVQA